MSSEPQGTANVRAFKLLDVVKLLPSVAWALMSAVAFPAYAGMGWYTPAILAVVSTLLSAGFAYEILTYHRRFKYVVAGMSLLPTAPPLFSLGKQTVCVAKLIPTALFF
jgi:hypothetical protein